jgi:hypothetical protein
LALESDWRGEEVKRVEINCLLIESAIERTAAGKSHQIFSGTLFPHMENKKKISLHDKRAKLPHIAVFIPLTCLHRKAAGKTEKSDNSLKIALYQLANKKPSRALFRVCFFC